MAEFDDALARAKRTTSEFFQPATDLAGGMWDRFKGVLGEERGDYNNYLGRYVGAIQGQENLPHMFDRIGRELGLPTLQQNALQANQTMANIPHTYSGAARGFDVNQNQLNRIVGTKQAAYAPVVQGANLALQGAQDTLGQRIGFTQQEQQKQLLPYEKEQAFLTDYLARKNTNFTFAAEKELSTALARAAAGQTFTGEELNRYNEIAKAKIAYDQAVKVAEINAAASRYGSDKTAEGTRLTALATLGKNF